MPEEKEAAPHPIFVHDPEEWMQYVYKKVSVVTSDGSEHEGWVYTIDPVSQSIVLVQFVEERTQLSIILRDAVNKTTILAESNPSIKEKLDALFHATDELKLSDEDVKAKKLRLKSWLEKNRLPVEMTGSHEEVLTISGALTIQPPYSVNDCHSTNEIILGRIQGLIKNMPEDHEQW
ncbi:gem-associated protein 6-like [Babylonia areolata]|uniref:gem-associated protein 6-like n=1 Tax=Babylonia areolata TaxID=304850 RepID=UPI003FD3A833